MLFSLRLSLILAGFVFSYAMGRTIEQSFILTVSRLMSVEPANLLVVNVVNCALLLFPVFVLIPVFLTAFSGEEVLKKRFLSAAAGFALGTIFYKFYSLWWMMGRTLDLSGGSWMDTLSARELFIFEGVLPFIILGLLTALPVALKDEVSQIQIMAPLTSVSLFIWFLITRRVPEISNIGPILTAFIIISLFGWICAFFIKKIRSF